MRSTNWGSSLLLSWKPVQGRTALWLVALAYQSQTLTNAAPTIEMADATLPRMGSSISMGGLKGVSKVENIEADTAIQDFLRAAHRNR